MSARLGYREIPKVLSVDDEATARIRTRLALQSCGFEVIDASSGREALETFANERPDLVLLDVHMDDVNGFEVCTAIRGMEGGKELPVVILTGDQQPDTIRQAFEAGATDFEAKDVSATVLGQRVKFLLRARETLDELHESERRLESAQRLARMANFEWQPAKSSHAWSPMMYTLLGLDEGECQPDHDRFLGSVHPEDLAQVRHALRKAAAEGTSYSMDHRVLQPEGTELVLQHRGEAVRDMAGKIVGVTGTLQDITELRRAEDRVRRLAYYDSVTGLPNRTLFHERLSAAVHDARRRRTSVAVVFMDLDNFKAVNDSFGHASGDQLLVEASERLQQAVRATDAVSRFGPAEETDSTLCRLGGDEFVVLLTDVQSGGNAARVARRILSALRKPFLLEGEKAYVTASVGIAMYPNDGEDPATLLKHADSAMYAAKDEGRDGMRFFDAALNDQASERLSIERGLRMAIARDELLLHYQPIVNADDGSVVGGECLIRWQHPEQGLVYPDSFLQIAEDSGLIVPVDEWVLRTACTQQRAWAQSGLDVPLSVNISSRHFQSRGFVDKLTAIMRETRVNPSRLSIDLTDGVLLAESSTAVKNLRQVRALGVAIDMDDPGTGYSSLSYLRQFKVDRIKLDRSFIRDLDTDVDSVALAEAIATVSLRLGIVPLAEGVESTRQREILTGLGYQQMQGFLFAEPGTSEAFVRLAAAHLMSGTEV
jgi:PAS domain S-box-containing protein